MKMLWRFVWIFSLTLTACSNSHSPSSLALPKDTLQTATQVIATTDSVKSISLSQSADPALLSTDTALVLRIVPSLNNTYGYEIISHGKLVIRQLTIPGQPGNAGFASQETAEKIARLVSQKISQNINPPLVTYEELQRLNALK